MLTKPIEKSLDMFNMPHVLLLSNKGLNGLFEQCNPVVYTVDGASGIFLTVKGSLPVSCHVEMQYSAGNDADDATLAALGLFAP